MKTRQAQSLLLFWASFYVFLFLPLMPLWAQMITDVDAPIIQLEPGPKSIWAGEALTLKATISDNTGVQEVTLFYRRAGETKYAGIQMKSLEGTAYSATIPGQEVAGLKMEYYIEASDKAHNISMRGFKIDPLTLTILAPLPPARDLFSLRTEETADISNPTLKKPWYKRWWVWTIAVAFIGAAAVAGGGGGNAKDGSATISGPIP